jgi:hypothetical protein
MKEIILPIPLAQVNNLPDWKVFPQYFKCEFYAIRIQKTIRFCQLNNAFNKRVSQGGETGL